MATAEKFSFNKIPNVTALIYDKYGWSLVVREKPTWNKEDECWDTQDTKNMLVLDDDWIYALNLSLPQIDKNTKKKIWEKSSKKTEQAAEVAV